LSFTVDTVRILREAWPADTAFLFLIGSDCLARLRGWKGIDALHAMLRFAVLPRGDGEVCIDDPRLIPVPMGRVALSSTLVRNTLARGASINGMVPSAVETYLRDRQLFAPARALAVQS